MALTKFYVDELGRECSKCNEYKTYDHYQVQKEKRIPYRSWCRECERKRRIEYNSRKEVQIMQRNYNIKYPEVRKKCTRNYFFKNKEEIYKKRKETDSAEKNRIYRKNYDNKKTTPGVWVKYKGKRAEVMDRKEDGVIAIRQFGKIIYTYKKHLTLWKGEY